MSSLIGLLKRNYKAHFNPPVPSASERPLKFGILGAALIAPPALITPAKSHPDVQVFAVAARDIKRAEAFAKKHDIPKWYGGKDGYQELLDNPEIDVIYNPLPNGLHYEWTMKALAAGKHVLLEKPSADTAEEARNMFDLAERKGLVLLEAFHYRFHPAVQRVKAIVDSGELGAITSVYSALAFPKGFVKGDNIRLNYDLGGGALMDCGCYTMNALRYIMSREPEAVVEAHADPWPGAPLVDNKMTAKLMFPSSSGGEPIPATLIADFAVPRYFGLVPRWPDISIIVTCERGSVELFNFPMPVIWHYITVRPNGGKARTEKAYTFGSWAGEGTKGEEWWTTYRYQLEAFVDQIRGRNPQTWLSREDSIGNMHWIEQIYEKSGLGSRPHSQFKLPEETSTA